MEGKGGRRHARAGASAPAATSSSSSPGLEVALAFPLFEPPLLFLSRCSAWLLDPRGVPGVSGWTGPGLGGMPSYP